MAEGWKWLLNARKPHYFVDQVSLCRGWMTLGSVFEQGNDDSPDNCVTCRKKLVTRRNPPRRGRPPKETTHG